MKVDLDEVKEIIKDTLADQTNVEEFEVFWKKRMSESEDERQQWIAEALVNNYLRFEDLKTRVIQR